MGDQAPERRAMIDTYWLDAPGVICALGADTHTVWARLKSGDTSGLRRHSGWLTNRDVTLACVDSALPEISDQVPTHLHSRNNRLLLAATQQIEPSVRAAIDQYGAARIGVVLGTSTSGVNDNVSGFVSLAEKSAWPTGYDYRRQALNSPAEFLADWLGTKGPAYTLSTACTSSARAMLSARRLLQLNICDAVICGGVDSLCRLTINGFAALEAISETRCLPFSANRSGINIGEAATLFLMHRGAVGEVAFLGGAGSSDAWHMSAPEPNGTGASKAMRDALTDAGLQASDIGWVNLHGTGTALNDAMESIAMQNIFPSGVPCTSTKGMTGHTLGTAGALEAALAWLSLSRAAQNQPLIQHVWDGIPDPLLPALDLCNGTQRYSGQRRRIAMSNSFAFGGNNTSLILAEAP